MKIATVDISGKRPKIEHFDIRPLQYFQHMGHKFAVHKSVQGNENGTIVYYWYQYTVSHFETGWAVYAGGRSMKEAKEKALQMLDARGEETCNYIFSQKEKINENHTSAKKD